MYVVVEHEEGSMARIISQHKDITRANESMIETFQKELDERGIDFHNWCWNKDGSYADDSDEVYIEPDKWCSCYGSLNYWLFILEVKED